MNENILKLILEFERIKKLGWIEGVQKGNKGNVGLTFEKAIGKEFEKSSNPDYLGIEIKTKKSTLIDHMTLFNLTPDSYENAIKDIQSKYGYPDYDIKYFKIFNMQLSRNKYNYSSGKKYAYKLNIKQKEEKLVFTVYNDDFVIVDESVSWSFESIKERLIKKLSYLAFIDAKRQYLNGIEYFRYTHIAIYKLKGFAEFIELLKKGEIKVVFRIGVYKIAEKFGDTYDHGTAFCINKRDLEFLFDKIISR